MQSNLCSDTAWVDEETLTCVLRPALIDPVEVRTSAVAAHIMFSLLCTVIRQTSGLAQDVQSGCCMWRDLRDL